MKRTLPLFFLALLNLPLCAQFPNWGWAPAITVSQSGSSLTCTTFDPIQNVSRTTSISNVDNYQYGDGVLAWVTPGGTVGGLVYDFNLGSWRQSTFSSNTGNTIENVDGVIAWVSAAGTVGGAIYDPIQSSWEYTTFSSNTGNTILNRAGVIAWVSAAGTVGGAVYDPAQQSWEYTTFSSNTGNAITNAEGVIGWVSAAGTVGGAVYDPGQQSWEYTSFNSNSGNSILNGDGVIAWISTAGTVGGAVYDHSQGAWEYTTFGNSSSYSNLAISDGTIVWNSSSGFRNYGYNMSSQSWENNYNTDLACKFFISHSSGSAPFITYFWCLSFGGHSYSYSGGDGHIINRRWAFKQYDNFGSYSPTLSLLNSITNTNCKQTVSVGGVGVEEAAPLQVTVYPNPIQGGQKLNVQAESRIDEIRLLDLLGRELFKAPVRQRAVEIELAELNLAPGTLVLEILLSNGQQVERRVLLH